MVVFTDYYPNEFHRDLQIEAQSNQLIAGSPEHIGMAVLISSSEVTRRHIPVYTSLGLGLPPHISGVIYDLSFVDMKLGIVVETKRF